MPNEKYFDKFYKRDQPFSTDAKLSEKLSFVTPCVYYAVRNVCFSENSG